MKSLFALILLLLSSTALGQTLLPYYGRQVTKVSLAEYTHAQNTMVAFGLWPGSANTVDTIVVGRTTEPSTDAGFDAGSYDSAGYDGAVPTGWSVTVGGISSSSGALVPSGATFLGVLDGGAVSYKTPTQVTTAVPKAMVLQVYQWVVSVTGWRGSLDELDGMTIWRKKLNHGYEYRVILNGVVRVPPAEFPVGKKIHQ